MIHGLDNPSELQIVRNEWELGLLFCLYIGSQRYNEKQAYFIPGYLILSMRLSGCSYLMHGLLLFA